MNNKCGGLDEALELFVSLSQRKVPLWNFIIRAYGRQGKTREALHFFNQMLQEGILPNKFTFVNIFSACASHAGLAEGKRTHVRVWNTEFESDVVVGAALVNMYGKSGSVHDAMKTFVSIPKRDVVVWTAMIGVYGKQRDTKKAMEMFDQMQVEGVKPNKVTFICILDCCADCAALDEGKQMHDAIRQSGIKQDVILVNAIVNMYGKCGNLGTALRIFHTMPERNIVSWNVIISVHAQHQKSKEAFELFNQMQQEGLNPNRITFLCILEACTSCAALDEGSQVHIFIASTGLDSDLMVGTALLSFYGKCGSLQDSFWVFDRMPKQDIVLWNAMIGAYAHHGHVKEALQLFDQMQWQRLKPNNSTFVSILDACASCAALKECEEVHRLVLTSGIEEDVVVRTALMNIYGKLGKLEDAWSIFDNMPYRNVVSWNAMIAICAQNGLVKETLMFFDQMLEEGFEPNKLTFLSMLDACAICVTLAEGKIIHSNIIASGLEVDLSVGNALVNTYGKCGSLDDAWTTFNKIVEQSVVSWSAMIEVCAKHGHAMKALQLCNRMNWGGVMQNSITYLNILSACNHDGLVDEAFCCFKAMTQDHGKSPTVDHYTCLIDLLGRAGQLDEAENLLNSIPCQPVAVSFMALLGACRDMKDLERGGRVVKQICELDRESAMPFIMLSNIHATTHTGGSVHKQ